MRTTAFVLLLALLGVSPQAQTRGAVPAPESVFGFTAGADYKLATYDQSIEYFKKLAASSRYIKLVEAGKTSQGRTMYFALISRPENLAQARSVPRDLRSAWRIPQGLTDAEAQRLATEGKALVHIDGGLHATEVAGPAAHAAAGLRPRSAEANEPATQGDARQRRPDAVADDQPRRPADGGRVVHEERRHAVRAVGAAAALPGIRRPRQQPRRLHAQHDRVARASSTRGASGSRRSSTCTTRSARFRRASGCRRSRSRSASRRRP